MSGGSQIALVFGLVRPECDILGYFINSQLVSGLESVN